MKDSKKIENAYKTLLKDANKNLIFDKKLNEKLMKDSKKIVDAYKKLLKDDRRVKISAR